MKKTFYLGLLVLLCINLSCETDEIFVDNQNNDLNTIESLQIDQENNLEHGENSVPITTVSSQNSNINPSRLSIDNPLSSFGDPDIGGGDPGDGGDPGLEGIGGDDGTIYDGTNTLSSPPDVYGVTASITFANGTSEVDKRALRITYQVTGELLYFEQCPSDPQTELWYLANSNVVINDCSNTPFPCSGTREENPPNDHPPLSTVITRGATRVIGEIIRQIVITEVTIILDPNTFCTN